MRNIQIVLNAILSKNIFEYILVDTDLNVLESSSGVDRYLNARPKDGDDILEYIPEFVGNEDEIKKIFVKRYCLFTLETVHKNGYYLNISIEYCDAQTAIVLLHNVTAITINQQSLLQYSNESTLLYNTLDKVLNNQNVMIFVASKNHIEFANQKFLDYFDIEDLEMLKNQKLDIYKYINKNIKDYDQLYHYVLDEEREIILKNDVFLLQVSKIEATHNLFTLTKITDISYKANRDYLTGLYRKNYLTEVGEQLIEKKQRFALVVLDLDNFKNINDTYGHLVGDNVLKRFVYLVKQKIRKNDIFARWGGEEFLLLMKDTTPMEIKERIEEIRKDIQMYNFDIAGSVTCSFGIACLKEQEDMDNLLYRADKALYEAKNSGKNRIVFKMD